MPDLDFYDLENYDLDGPTNGMVNYKSGSYTLTSASRNFIRDNGGISAYRYILISGLNFRPKKIAVRPRNGVTNVGVFYDFDSKKSPPSANADSYNLSVLNNIDNGTMFIHRVYELPGDSVSTGQNAAVTDSAFLLPINGSAIAGDILDWEAYG